MKAEGPVSFTQESSTDRPAFSRLTGDAIVAKNTAR